MTMADLSQFAALHDDHSGPAIRRIVVPLDGAPLAERALGPAIALARALNASLLLMRANESGGAPTRTGGAGRGTVHTASLYLARLEQSLRSRGLRVQSRVPLGPAAEAIVEVARQSAADLIVMATRADPATARQSHLSTVRDVLIEADVPVLLFTVATDDPFARGGNGGFTVLAPLGDAPNDQTLSYAALVSRALDGQVVLLKAPLTETDGRALRRDDPALYALSTLEARDKAEAELERQSREMRSQSIHVRTALVDGDMLDELCRLAPARGDLIIMGIPAERARRQGSVPAVFRILSESQVPVLVTLAGNGAAS